MGVGCASPSWRRDEKLPQTDKSERSERGAAHESGSANNELRQRCFVDGEELLSQNRFAEALAKHREAVRLGIDPEPGAASRWKCCMMLGDFEAAWRETDFTEARREDRGDSGEHLPVHWQRVWDGTPLAGRRVLVRCYHGLGDTLQFSRYLPILERICASVVVHCQPALVELIQPLCETAEVVAVDCYADEPAPIHENIETEIELMELPYAFRTIVDTIPRRVPYLRVPSALVDAERAALCAPRLGNARVNVGVVWSSGSWNAQRSVSLERLRRLDEIPGIRLVSLQQGTVGDDLTGWSGGLDRKFAPAEGPETVLKTAAILFNLDLILSVDTMVAHLAGALGKPVWTLLPYSPDWRWMSGREDSPWYPTMRLFRQERPGDWSSVLDAVCAALKTLTGEGQNRTVSPQEEPCDRIADANIAI